jgi:hypothetical protein
MMARRLKFPRCRFFLLTWGAISILAFNSIEGGTFSYLQPGMQIPDFHLQSFEGTEITLSDALGTQPAVIVFWASWSP